MMLSAAHSTPRPSVMDTVTCCVSRTARVRLFGYDWGRRLVAFFRLLVVLGFLRAVALFFEPRGRPRRRGATAAPSPLTVDTFEGRLPRRGARAARSSIV